MASNGLGSSETKLDAALNMREAVMLPSLSPDDAIASACTVPAMCAARTTLGTAIRDFYVGVLSS